MSSSVSSLSTTGSTTSNVNGLASGLDTASIISGLMAIKRQAVDKLTAKSDAETAKQSTWSSIMSSVLGLQLSAYNLSKASTFDARQLSISNDAVLSATVSGTAAQGSSQFTVDRLATTNQFNSTGFNDYNTTPVGAGTMTFELGNGDVKRQTNLNDLNGGAGVTRGTIKLTDRDGQSATVDLTHAMTIDDVLSKINASNLNLTAKINSSGNGLDITATGTGTGTLKVEETNQGTTAADLGIKGSIVGSTLSGTKVSFLTSTSSLSSLNDGLGISQKGLIINGTSIALSSANNLGDVVNAINGQSGTTNVSAAIRADGQGIQLTGTGFAVAENGGTTAKDLGILNLTNTGNGDNLLSGMNSVLLKSLNGASGILGTDFTVQGVVSKDINISGMTSLSQVMDAINTETTNTNVASRFNQAKNGLELYSTDGSAFTIAEKSGTTASSLGILGSSAAGVLKGTNLNVAYLSKTTDLSTMNQGDGVRKGTISITNKLGNAFTVNLSSSTIKTLGDVIDSINGAGSTYQVTAALNATGDGLLISDASGGTGNLSIAETNNGKMATDLGILGSSTGATVNGSFEKSVTISSTNTLQDVRDAINALGINLKATIINDGSNNPYRLSITSTKSGVVGRMVIGNTVNSLNLNASVAAQNATLIMGDPTAENALFVASSSNTVSNFIPGVTLALKTASSTPITLSITSDPTAITAGIKDFVDKYNKAIASVNDQLTYDSTNNTSGPLFGDSTVMQLQQQIYNTINRTVTGVSGNIKSAGQVGLNLALDGTLSLDTTVLNSALSTNLSGVVDFFTFQNNDALTATASASATDSPWTVSGAHDGNTKVTDFASGTTGWQANNGASYQLDFGSNKELTSVLISGVDTTSTDILKSFDLQYWNNTTSSWTTFQSVTNNTAKDTAINFPTGIVTNKIRLNNMQGTGTKAKLLDFKATESTGFASTYDLTLSKITDSGTGMIATAMDGSVQNQTTITNQITSMNDRLAIEETRLRDQYTKLETMINTLKTQSSSFTSQLTGINNTWNYKNTTG